MATLHLIEHPPYGSRYLTLSDTSTKKDGIIFKNVNFNPNDGVDTIIVLNEDLEQYGPRYRKSYLRVFDDSDEKYEGSWYIMDTKRLRKKQYQLTLRRDVLTDYIDEIKEAPVFCEKGMVSFDDPAIFNNENMTYNQIKTKEIMLKDQSQCPWICIYAMRKTGDSITTFDLDFIPDSPIAQTFSSKEEFESSPLYRSQDLVRSSAALNDVEIKGYYDLSGTYSYGTYSYTGGQDGEYGTYDNDGSTSDFNSIPYEYRTRFKDDFYFNIRSYREQVYNTISSTLPTVLNIINTQDNFDGYEGMNTEYGKCDQEAYQAAIASLNQIIQVNDNDTKIYYKVNSYDSNYYADLSFTPSESGQLGNAWKSLIDLVYQDHMEGGIITSVNFGNVDTNIIQTSVNELQGTISQNRYHLNDAPYDMFCLPYGDLKMSIVNKKVSNFEEIEDYDKRTSLAIANELIANYSGNNGSIIDAQILPYCPLVNTLEPHVYSDSVELDINCPEAGYTVIRSQGKAVAYILHADQSSFFRQIELDEPIYIDNYKVENECDLYRLCSPNYSGIFEFNAAKNGGVSLFRVQCTYKPFTPYIKIFPQWGRLYGKNFGKGDFDARGLVCGGDFSLPMLSDAWATFERNNKNYQMSFDREVQSIELNNNIQLAKDITGTVTGAAGGAVSGAIAGSIVPGIGTAIGAVIGGIAGAAGGIADTITNDITRRDALDLKKDQFGYQLGNIKALPQSLSKVSAYNVDNKYFPFLEYYTCTMEEKTALVNKILLNGMTVMRAGLFKEFFTQKSFNDFILGRINDKINNDYDTVRTLCAQHKLASNGNVAYFKFKLAPGSGGAAYDGFVVNESAGSEFANYTNINTDDQHLWNAIAEELDKGFFINIADYNLINENA